MLNLEASKANSNGAERVLSGRLLTAQEDLIIIEAEVIGHDLIWSPSRLVHVLAPSGTRRPAALIGEQSTRPGPVQRGQVVRIAVTPDGGGNREAARAILINNGTTSLRVEV
jgi:hypothetical protein